MEHESIAVQRVDIPVLLVMEEQTAEQSVAQPREETVETVRSILYNNELPSKLGMHPKVL